MPGALTSPLLNPLQSYLESTPGGTEQLYNDAVSKGYKYVGGQNPWDASGAQGELPWYAKNIPTDASQGYNNASSSPHPFGGGGGAGGGSGGTTSLATGSSFSSGGPYKADAQLAQVQSQFDDILKRGMSSLNEAAAISGGFSGGIPFENRQKYITDIGLQRGSAIERIMNDIMGRNQSYELEKQRLADAQKAAMYGGGSQRFSGGTTGGNPNQDILSLFQQMMGGGGDGGSYNSKDVNPGGAYQQSTGGAVNITKPWDNYNPTFGSAEPTQYPGESRQSYYNRLNAWHDVQRRGY
jgi:hypothetical protein